MSHLSLETLARLVEEAPTGAEARHLAACAVCRQELEALREQTGALGMLPALEPPPDSWPELEERLEREGLIRPAPGRPARRTAPLLRLAASVMLFLAGGLAGYLARGAQPAPSAVATASGAGPDGPVAVPAGPDGTVDQAARRLRQAEAAYLAALSRYAELSDGPVVSDPAARLAALEGIVLTTREALRQAPADPVINGYHLTAVAQRDAMMRQLSLDEDDPWF